MTCFVGIGVEHHQLCLRRHPMPARPIAPGAASFLRHSPGGQRRFRCCACNFYPAPGIHPAHKPRHLPGHVQSRPAGIVRDMLKRAFFIDDNRCQDHQPCTVRQADNLVDNTLVVCRATGLPADRAVRNADARKQQAQIIINFGNSGHCGARVAAGRFLVDRYRRADRPSIWSTSGFSISPKNCRA